MKDRLVDRGLPASPESEEAIIGLILHRPDCLDRIPNLRVDHFADRRLGILFSACLRLRERGVPPDPTALAEELGDDLQGIGGVSYIAGLRSDVARVANIAHFAKTVTKNAAARQVARLGQHLLDSACEGSDVIAFAKSAQSELAAILEELPGSSQVMAVPLDSVQRERVSWLWLHRIPLGKVTVLDGDPGLGKSALTLDIAARVTRGNEMPDDTTGIQGSVILLNAEDGLADTIRGRLEVAGADCSMVHSLTTVPSVDGQRVFEIPGDLTYLSQEVKRLGAKLVIVDPLMAFLGGKVNSFHDHDTRRALAPLAILAEATGVAVIVVRHLNKGNHANPLYRGGGSIGIIGAARCGLLVAADPNDAAIRVLAVTKSNVGPMPASLNFTLEAAGEYNETVRVTWTGQSSHSATDLLAVIGDEGGKARTEAVDFLRTVLSDGPVPVLEVQRQAQSAGISRSTLRRAKTTIGVQSRKGSMESGWLWELGEGVQT
jgi:hypothetical protein